MITIYKFLKFIALLSKAIDRYSNIVWAVRHQNILKRKGNQPVEEKVIIKIGTYNFHPKELLLKGLFSRKILTEKEMLLLKYFCEHKGKIISCSTILNLLWEREDYFNGRSLDVFISRLRKYPAEDSNVSIESLREIGFRLVDYTSDAA